MRLHPNLHPRSSDRDHIGEIFLRLCEGVDSGTSLACWLMYQYGEFETLARKRIHPSAYNSASQFRDDYLVVSYLSKFKGLETGLDVKAEALRGFHAAEQQCRETNHRLRQMRPANTRVEPALFLATMKIASILGDIPNLELLEGRWSGGATASLSAADANAIRKLDESPITVTRGAKDLLKREIQSDYHWGAALCKSQVEGAFSVLDCNFRVIEHNKVTTVPKDATKDRTIAAEPTGNVFLQLGVGQYIRSRLKKRIGIDLDSQEANQLGARTASKTGEWVTVDLKSASDTVSTQLVYQLLPLDWSMLLDQLRCREGLLSDGTRVRYEKFSSMGNGFTFELETLIFAGLVWGCTQLDDPEGPTLVYGDDIVCSKRAYPRLLEVLQYCGFTVNTEKSHADGYFRESCGKHYWNGSDVTPVYQKERFYNEQTFIRSEVYRCANRLIRLAWRRGHFRWLDSKLKRPWRYAAGLVPRKHIVPLDAFEDEFPLPLDPLQKTGLSDDGLALPASELLQWVVKGSVRHGLLTLPVLSFIGAERVVPPFYHRALLAYWLRFVPVEPLAGVVGCGRKGYYVSRRRTYPVGTPDVAWM